VHSAVTVGDVDGDGHCDGDGHAVAHDDRHTFNDVHGDGDPIARFIRVRNNDPDGQRRINADGNANCQCNANPVTNHLDDRNSNHDPIGVSVFRRNAVKNAISNAVAFDYSAASQRSSAQH
jgi:hypothetical protein